MITRFDGPTGYGTLVALYEILFSLEFVLAVRGATRN